MGGKDLLQKGLLEGYISVQYQVVVTVANHEFGEVPHDGFSLHVEVPHHFVAPPVTNELYDVVVYA